MEISNKMMLPKSMFPSKKSKCCDIVKFLTMFLYENTPTAEEAVRTVWKKVYEGKKWSLSEDERDVIVTLCAYMDKASVVKRVIKLGLDSHSEFSEPQEIERVLDRKEAEIERMMNDIKSLKFENDELKEAFLNKRSEVESLGRELKTLHEKILKVGMTSETVREVLEDSGAPWYPDFVKARHAINAELTVLKDEHFRVKESFAEKRDEVEKLKNELEKYREEAAASGKKGALEFMRFRWEHDVSTLKSEKDELKEDLIKKQDEVETLRSEVKHLQEKAVEDESVSSENDELEQKDAEIKSLRGELEWMRKHHIPKTTKEEDNYYGFSSM